MEEVANRIVSCLYDTFRESEHEPSCQLIRLFRTMRLSDLEPEVQAFAEALMPDQRLEGDTRCLTLLATRGSQPQWNSRRDSVGHQAIPLPSSETIDSIPMISQLIAQLGIDVASVVKPDPELVLETEQTTYNVFFVENAKESAFIPAKEDFVDAYDIASVLGCGGLLPSGEMFALLMFSQHRIERATADMFRNAAMNIKLALLPFDDACIFAGRKDEQ